MNLSIVIPVYNEAERLEACLAAIARQSVSPLEVIVVDNNSTDESHEVALRFSFVKLLTESRQGVVYARNRGFDAAQGEIIGRIDADTILPPDWTTRLQAIFTDQTVAAVSGAPHYYDFALDTVADAIDHRLRAHLARALGRDNFLWGANMAVRRSAWLEVRHELCNDRRQHEDFDLGIHLENHNLQVEYDTKLLVGVSSRRIDTGFIDYVRYTLVSPRTYAQHSLRSRFHMYPVLFACWFFYFPGRFIYRAYDPLTGEFSWAQLLGQTQARIDPTSNIA